MADKGIDGEYHAFIFCNSDVALCLRQCVSPLSLLLYDTHERLLYLTPHLAIALLFFFCATPVHITLLTIVIILPRDRRRRNNSPAALIKAAKIVSDSHVM